jgi:hypothetical protein
MIALCELTSAFDNPALLSEFRKVYVKRKTWRLGDLAFIRLATIDDVEHIARVHVQAWRETYRGLVPDAMLDRLSAEDRAVMWRSAFADPAKAPALLVVEDVNGTIVGFGSAGRARSDKLQTEGEITAISSPARAAA